MGPSPQSRPQVAFGSIAHVAAPTLPMGLHEIRAAQLRQAQEHLWTVWVVHLVQDPETPLDHVVLDEGTILGTAHTGLICIWCAKPYKNRSHPGEVCTG